MGSLLPNFVSFLLPINGEGSVADMNTTTLTTAGSEKKFHQNSSKGRVSVILITNLESVFVLD